MIQTLPESLIKTVSNVINPVTFRKMEVGDSDDVMKLEQQTDTPWKNKASFLKAGQDTTVVEHKNKIVGYYITKKTPDNNSHIVKLHVSTSHRNMGIGGMMLDNIKQKNSTVSLHVKENNTPAISLYKKHGFSIVETKPNYYSDGKSAHYMSFSGNK